jgi:hypothetical protein
MSTLHESAGETLAATWEVELDEVTVARFARLVVERGMEHLSGDYWSTERMTFEGLFDLARFTFRDRTWRGAVLDLSEPLGEECLAYVYLGYGSASVRIAARRIDALAAARSWLRDRYPVAEPAAEEQAVTVTFWSLADRPRQTSRRLDVPCWTEIAGNYPPAAAVGLAELMSPSFRPERGQLILWHGPPGTGKTHALRALGWAWREWCRLHYVTDPDVFFGTRAAYMLDVLLDEPDDDGPQWRLLILEDTGELLATDAKEQTGQGLSRLLNVVDGLIGQGLRVVVLVTTNEPLKRLHPAVARPGRCAAQVEFGPFDADEAREWLDRHGVDAAPGACTLATLFAHASGTAPPARHPVGFAR